MVGSIPNLRRHHKSLGYEKEIEGMSSFTSKQMKAIKWYMDENPGLRLQLSTPPNIYFKDKRNRIVSFNITALTQQYDSWNEEDKKERARQRKQADTKTPRVV